MKILGKSRGVATVIAVALGLAVVTDGSLASAQMAPTGLPVPPPPPAAKPGPAAQPAQPLRRPPRSRPRPLPARSLRRSPQRLRSPPTRRRSRRPARRSSRPATSPERSPTSKRPRPRRRRRRRERFIGLCQDNLGHYPEAVTAYEKFLATRRPRQHEAAGRRGEEARRSHQDDARQGARRDHAARRADHRRPRDEPERAAQRRADADRFDLPAGHHTLKLTAEGYVAADKEIDVTYASKQDVRVELVKSEPPPPPPPPVVAEAPQPAPAPPPPPPPEPRSKVPAYVTGAVAIIATGVGIGFGVKALGQSSDFEKNPTTQKADDGENNALVADMMFGIAITFGVTSAVLFLSNDAPQSAKAEPAEERAARTRRAKKAPAKITITPTPYVTPSGGGAGALVRF